MTNSTTPNTPANGGQILTDALLPCPFCGAHLPHMWSLTMDGKRHTINCTECPGRVDCTSSSREQAIIAWNRRASLAAVPASEPVQHGDSFKPVYWFSVLTKCARLLNLPCDEPIPSGVLKAVESLAAAPAPVSGMPDLANLRHTANQALEKSAAGLERAGFPHAAQIHRDAIRPSPQAPDCPVAPTFNPNASCNPTATQCPKCNNDIKLCDAFTATLPAAPAPIDTARNYLPHSVSDKELVKFCAHFAYTPEQVRCSLKANAEWEGWHARASIAPAPAPTEQAAELPPLQVIPLGNDKELLRDDRGNSAPGWLLYGDGKLVRGLNIFEAGFIDSAIRAALTARQAPTETPKLNQQQEETITMLRMWSEAGHRDLRLLSSDKFGVLALLAGFDRQAPDSRDAALEEAAKACGQQYTGLGGPIDDPHPDAVLVNGAINDCVKAIRALKGPAQ